MGVSEVVGIGRPGNIGDERESGGGVRHRGGAMQGGSGAGRDAGTGLRAGRTKVAN